MAELYWLNPAEDFGLEIDSDQGPLDTVEPEVDEVGLIGPLGDIGLKLLVSDFLYTQSAVN